MGNTAVWERERVLSLTPHIASRTAGQQLAVPSRWSSLGVTNRCVWGRCRGSAGTAYETMVVLGAEPAYSCSCPSRRTPCKHALGLLLLWSAGSVPAAATEADFVARWFQGRAGRPARQSTALDAADGVADPEAAARRGGAAG